MSKSQRGQGDFELTHLHSDTFTRIDDNNKSQQHRTTANISLNSHHLDPCTYYESWKRTEVLVQCVCVCVLPSGADLHRVTTSVRQIQRESQSGEREERAHTHFLISWRLLKRFPITIYLASL